jgi:hypothetical protein
MSESVARIFAQIDSFSQQERAGLAHVILCSLEPEDPGAAQAWNDELESRAASLRGGQAVEVGAEKVFANWRQNRS